MMALGIQKKDSKIVALGERKGDRFDISIIDIFDDSSLLSISTTTILDRPLLFLL